MSEKTQIKQNQANYRIAYRELRFRDGDRQLRTHAGTPLTHGPLLGKRQAEAACLSHLYAQENPRRKGTHTVSPNEWLQQQQQQKAKTRQTKQSETNQGSKRVDFRVFHSRCFWLRTQHIHHDRSGDPDMVQTLRIREEVAESRLCPSAIM